MSGLILPPGYRESRRSKIRPERFSFYAKHKCGGEAFWLTKRFRTPLDFTALGIMDVWFEDGQIKTPGKLLSEFNCASCQSRLRMDDPKELTVVRILNQKDYDRLHAEVHNEVPAGELCKSCGKIKRG